MIVTRRSVFQLHPLGNNYAVAMRREDRRWCGYILLEDPAVLHQVTPDCRNRHFAEMATRAYANRGRLTQL